MLQDGRSLILKYENETKMFRAKEDYPLIVREIDRIQKCVLPACNFPIFF